jgi:hypothetical protein
MVEIWMIVLKYPSGKEVRFGRGITCMATVLKAVNPELEDADVPAAHGSSLAKRSSADVVL